MDLGSLLLSLALVIIVAAFVARPLVEQAANHRESASPADDLIARREAVLIELRDLDFDHATGKVSDGDYAEQRARLVAKGSEVLRALDQLTIAHDSSDSLDDEIEKAVAARRTKAARASAAPQPSGAACPQCGQPLRSGDKFCATCGASLAHLCGACGQPAQPGDKFCARCGAKLPLAAEAA